MFGGFFATAYCLLPTAYSLVFMTAPVLVSGLGQIAERYDTVLCDVWGVIHNGRESFPSACEALERFAGQHGPVVLISNAPRPSAAVLPQLRRLGVPDAAWNAFVTSGDATRAELEQRAPGKVWRLGPERDGVLYEGLDLQAVAPDKADFICCTGPYENEEGTPDAPDTYGDVFRDCAARGLTMICANPDRVVQRGEDLLWCAGALADLYEAIGGVVVMAGKPFSPVFKLALTEAARVRGEASAGRVLMIGDGVVTDVKGANAQGLDCLFVAGGVHGAEAVVGGRPVEAAVERILLSEGAHAAWVSDSLTW